MASSVNHSEISLRRAGEARSRDSVHKSQVWKTKENSTGSFNSVRLVLSPARPTHGFSTQLIHFRPCCTTHTRPEEQTFKRLTFKAEKYNLPSNLALSADLENGPRSQGLI